MKKLVQPIVDTILSWTISKKLTVWVVATIAMFSGQEIPDNWLYISLLYLGVQGWYDIATSLAKAKASAGGFGNNNPTGDTPVDELEK